MKTITLNVNLTFADDICDDGDIREVADNVAKAIEYYAGGQGIAPQNGDTYTKKIVVSEPFTETVVEIVISEI
jgi:hypothetical protein